MASPQTGQAAGIDLSTPVPLSASVVKCSAFVVKAPKDNAAPVYIGRVGVSGTTGHLLDPGNEFEYERSVQNAAPFYELSVSDFFMVGVSPDRVTWLASP